MNRNSLASRAMWRKGLTLMLLSVAVGCAGSEQEHPAAYQYEANPASVKNKVDRCAMVNEGCPCSDPGEILDCGKIVVKVDDYESCYAGSRLCAEDGTWGACLPDQAIVELTRKP